MTDKDLLRVLPDDDYFYRLFKYHECKQIQKINMVLRIYADRHILRLIFLENVDSWVLFFFGVEIYVTNKISS